MQRSLRKVVGCLVFLIGLLLILAGASAFAILKTSPDLLPKDSPVSKDVSLGIAILGTFAVIIPLIGSFMADIIGFNLLDIFRYTNNMEQGWRTETKTGSYFPFQVIMSPDEVLQSLLTGPGLMPDYNIPYQRRRSDRDITEEIRKILLTKKRIIITGIGGIGKTREVGRLLTNLVDEGFTILRAKGNARLDVDLNIPENLRSRLIFVFDDIHQRCADPISLISDSIKSPDFLDALQNFLEKIYHRFTTSEVYIIFIARSDTESWNYLQFPIHQIWKNCTKYDMPYPDTESQKYFITNIARKLDLNITDSDAQGLAEANDGTFRNLIQNIYRAKTNQVALDIKNFTTRQGITWSEKYEHLISEYGKIFSSIFDSIYILSKMEIVPEKSMVIELSTSFYSNFAFHWIKQPIWYFNKIKTTKLVNDLISNGEISLDINNNELSIHEMMLDLRGSDIDLNKITPMMWYYIKKREQNEIWIRFVRYTLFNANRYLLCIKILTQILKIEKDNSSARLLRANALLRFGMPHFALRDTSIAHSVDEKDVSILNFMGILNIICGNKKKAKEIFDLAISMEPNNDRIFLNRANLYMQQKDYELAEKDISDAIQLQPEKIHYYILRAQIRRSMKLFKASLEDLSIVERRQPNWSSIYVERSTLYMEKGDFDMAEKEVSTALTIKPNSDGAYYVKSLLAIKKGEIEIAHQYIMEAISLQPNNPMYYYIRAQIRLKQNHFMRSLEDIEKVINRDFQSADIFALRAFLLLRLGITKQSFNDANKAIELDENCYFALFTLARLYYRESKYDKSMNIINNYIAKKPDDDEAYHFRAHLYAMHNKFQLALEDFSSAISSNKKNEQHFICRSELLFKLKRDKLAMKDINFIMANFSNKNNVHFAYIDAYHHLEKLADIRKKYIKELEKDPDSSLHQTALAYIYSLMNEKQIAEKHLREALRKPNTDPVITKHQLIISRQCKKLVLSLLVANKLVDFHQDDISQLFFHTTPPIFFQKLIMNLNSGKLNPLNIIRKQIVRIRIGRRKQLNERDLFF